MTRKVFKADNKEDMDLLWSIVRPDVDWIERSDMSDKPWFHNKCGSYLADDFLIDFCGQDKITRPVDESEWIGQWGFFTDYESNMPLSRCSIGKLRRIDSGTCVKYWKDFGAAWRFFRPLTNEEWLSMKPKDK